MSRQLKFISDIMLSQTASGLAGEYICAASIIARGWRVAMSAQDAVDIICWHPETSDMLRVQVKACQASRQQSKKSRVSFNLGLGGTKRLPTLSDYDILACVSSEQRTVYYLPVTDVQVKKLNKPASFFETPDLESDSWARAVEIINEERYTKQATMRNNLNRRRSSSDRELSPINWRSS